MELKVSSMEEELQDLKSDKENLERVCGVYVGYLFFCCGNMNLLEVCVFDYVKN